MNQNTQPSTQAPTGEKSIFDKLHDTFGQAEDMIGNVANTATESVSSFTNQITGYGTPQEGQEDQKTTGQGMVTNTGTGGRRKTRSRSRSMKMRGGLNQDFGYNAAPVTDANVAEPTYMMEGGRRRRSRRRSRRHSRKRTCKRRRHKCCKKSCRKHHRHRK